MKSMKSGAFAATLASCASGLFLTLMATAAPAGADPTDPAAPLPPAPDSATSVQASGPETVVVPPNGIPHLASPDALPPGSTMDPTVMEDGDSPNVSYLKDLWHAVQNQEISGKEALLLGVAQRGMSTPYPDQAPGPNVPSSPGDPALATPLPADPGLPPPGPAISPVPPTP